MKKLLLGVAILSCCLTACKKDNSRLIHGTVLQKGGCYDDSWLVLVSNIDYSRQSFLCNEPQAMVLSSPNCSNSVYIRLPAHLAVQGRKIVFSVDAVQGSCLSFSLAPYHVDVRNLAAE